MALRHFRHQCVVMKGMNTERGTAVNECLQGGDGLHLLTDTRVPDHLFVSNSEKRRTCFDRLKGVRSYQHARPDRFPAAHAVLPSSVPVAGALEQRGPTLGEAPQGRREDSPEREQICGRFAPSWSGGEMPGRTQGPVTCQRDGCSLGR